MNEYSFVISIVIIWLNMINGQFFSGLIWSKFNEHVQLDELNHVASLLRLADLHVLYYKIASYLGIKL